MMGVLNISKMLDVGGASFFNQVEPWINAGVSEHRIFLSICFEVLYLRPEPSFYIF